MGWYYRKSLSFGPFRVNLSKTGVGWSLGGKGFRYGRNARGQRYIQAGRGGLYYRKVLSSTPAVPSRPIVTSAPVPSRPSPTSTPPPPPPPQAAPAPLQPPTPLTPLEIAREIMTAQSLPRWDRRAFIVGPAFFLLGLIAGSLAAAIILGGMAAGACILLHRHLIGQHGTHMGYDGLEATELTAYGTVQAALRHLEHATEMWASQTTLPGQTALRHDIVHLSQHEPPWVFTDIDCPNLITPHWHLCFLPHGLLIVRERQVHIIPYRDITVRGAEATIPSIAGGAPVGQITIALPVQSVVFQVAPVDAAKSCVTGLVAACHAYRALPP